jgi:preprotein translocase subunit SecA
LRGEDVQRKILDMMGDVTSDILDRYVNDQVKREDWDFKGLGTALLQQFGIKLDEGAASQWTTDQITEFVSSNVKQRYVHQRETIAGAFDHICRAVLLETIDNRWKEHLERIDRLKEGIQLRGYAQKDPLIEYKKEAFSMFQELNVFISTETVEKILKVQMVMSEDAANQLMLQRRRAMEQMDLAYAGADEDQKPSVFSGPVPARAQPARAQDFVLGQGSSEPDEGPKLNRADRRRLEKLNKKKK